MQQEITQYKIRINNFIRVPQVRVILADGENGGIMATRDAVRLAQDQGLDLIEINPKVSPPVCKIANYGKMKYEENKKQSEIRKHQKAQEMKEITFRPNTDFHDLEYKLNAAKEFLNDGHKVKFTIRFRGREITHPEIGKDKFDWIVEQLGDLISPTQEPNLDGKFMSMLVSPQKKS